GYHPAAHDDHRAADRYPAPRASLYPADRDATPGGSAAPNPADSGRRPSHYAGQWPRRRRLVRQHLCPERHHLRHAATITGGFADATVYVTPYLGAPARRPAHRHLHRAAGRRGCDPLGVTPPDRTGGLGLRLHGPLTDRPRADRLARDPAAPG